jgi:hypothetical protein
MILLIRGMLEGDDVARGACVTLSNIRRKRAFRREDSLDRLAEEKRRI